MKLYLNNIILFSMNFGIWARDKNLLYQTGRVHACSGLSTAVVLQRWLKDKFNSMYVLNIIVKLTHGLWVFTGVVFFYWKHLILISLYSNCFQKGFEAEFCNNHLLN